MAGYRLRRLKKMKQIRLKNEIRTFIYCPACPFFSLKKEDKISPLQCIILKKALNSFVTIDSDCPLEDYYEDCDNKEPPPPRPQFPESKPTQTAPLPPPADYRKPEIGIHINIKI